MHAWNKYKYPINVYTTQFGIIHNIITWHYSQSIRHDTINTGNINKIPSSAKTANNTIVNTRAAPTDDEANIKTLNTFNKRVNTTMNKKFNDTFLNTRVTMLIGRIPYDNKITQFNFNYKWDPYLIQLQNTAIIVRHQMTNQ